MLLPRLFLTRVTSGALLHETLTVTAGVAASAGRGETPRSEVGANIVRANANALASSSPKTTVPIGGAVLLVTGYPPLF